MPELGKSGSVGATGGQLPVATRRPRTRLAIPPNTPKMAP